jgi:hypothetical protein
MVLKYLFAADGIDTADKDVPATDVLFLYLMELLYSCKFLLMSDLAVPVSAAGNRPWKCWSRFCTSMH